MHNFPASDRLIRRVRGCSQRLGIHRLDYALAYRDRDQGILVLLGVLWALMSFPAVTALHGHDNPFVQIHMKCYAVSSWEQDEGSTEYTSKQFSASWRRVGTAHHDYLDRM